MASGSMQTTYTHNPELHTMKPSSSTRRRPSQSSSTARVCFSASYAPAQHHTAAHVQPCEHAVKQHRKFGRIHLLPRPRSTALSSRTAEYCSITGTRVADRLQQYVVEHGQPVPHSFSSVVGMAYTEQRESEEARMRFSDLSECTESTRSCVMFMTYLLEV